jgi:hypothetical protein
MSWSKVKQSSKSNHSNKRSFRDLSIAVLSSPLFFSFKGITGMKAQTKLAISDVPAV